MSEDQVTSAEPAKQSKGEIALELVKKQAPTAAVSAVVAVLAALAVSGGKDAAPPEVPALPELVKAAKDPDRPAAEPRKGKDGAVTRLVSCGDSTVAKVAGDDTAGVIALGDGAGGMCTVLFAAPWNGTVTCAVNGGTVDHANEHELAINDAGASVSYRCGATEQ